MSARPTSASSMKFCMFRAPIWITSAASSTASTCRGSISSVTTGSPVSSRASRRIASASSPSPWNVYGEVRGLNAPPRSHVAPASFDRARRLERLLAVLDRARPGDQPEELVPDLAAVDVDHRRVGRDLARDQLVRLQDRQHLLDAGVALERQRRQQLALADRADHGRLAPARDARVHARFLQPREHVLGLVGVALAPITISSSGDPFAAIEQVKVVAILSAMRIFSGIRAYRREDTSATTAAASASTRPTQEQGEAFFCIVDLHSITIAVRAGRAARGDARPRRDAVRDRARPRALDRVRPEPRHARTPRRPGC